jgi:hypothetical protein
VSETERLLDRALSGTTNYPVIDAVALAAGLESAAAAVAIIAIPGYLAARVAAALALAD